jgi:hypothetical protein
MVLDAGHRSEIARVAGLDERVVVDALDRLVGAGLVESLGEGRYLLLEEAFKRAARAEAEPAPPSEFPDQPREHRRILDQAFDGERLVHIPAKYSQRLVVLDYLVQRFEPGLKYSERQVNALLSKTHSDTATLRRYLVDASMLDRADGNYWRSGGTFETAPDN